MAVGKITFLRAGNAPNLANNTRYRELESDEKGRKVLMLKVSTSKIPVFCPDPDQPTRPTGSAAGGRGL